ncbi:hypothetical protein [Hansschlegelia plantiphila]|uniref:Uncharacterized protein n=1 Tax=Hansschlegelia plantiphila TaxID=374655 RepID=A0A9W6MVX1_9HYPH|nr:hypothetical protein [Hansschlegelia plantiphila]GLK68904.1 hypothetical protein GCM10008179_25420 [Hansschlegelia plantiphila]
MADEGHSTAPRLVVGDADGAQRVVDGEVANERLVSDAGGCGVNAIATAIAFWSGMPTSISTS